MSDQDILDAYNKGFYGAYAGYVNDNPYCIVGPNDLWAAYEKGYQEGTAEKKQAGND